MFLAVIFGYTCQVEGDECRPGEIDQQSALVTHVLVLPDDADEDHMICDIYHASWFQSKSFTFEIAGDARPVALPSPQRVESRRLIALR